jgi:hypothetical protein
MIKLIPEQNNNFVKKNRENTVKMVKLSLCWTNVIKHYAMKTYRGMDI